MTVSIGTRLDENMHKAGNKRSENGRFVFLVELAAFLSWTGCLAALFNEARYNHWAGRYDRFAKVLTFLECVEV